MEIISCTEAGILIDKTKAEIRTLVEQQKLTNYGNASRYMVMKEEVIKLKG